MTNTNQALMILRKIMSPMQEESVPTLTNKIIDKFKVGLRDHTRLVEASALLHKQIESKFGKDTADFVFERLENHDLIPPAIREHDLSTPHGYMAAHDKVLEMFSGAAIGGAFDGAQTNAATNATGMAAPTGPAKKKKPIKRMRNILNNRL